MVTHMKRKLPESPAAGSLQVDKNLDVGRSNLPFRLLRSLVLANYGTLWPGGAIQRPRRAHRRQTGQLGAELVLSVLGH